MTTQVSPLKQRPALEQPNLLQQMISPNDVVLDLGSFASGTTQALLSRRCRCYVEDLPVFLNDIKIHDDFDFETALRQHLVVANDPINIDVILTWDLFHYLDLTEIRALFNVLDDKISPGTKIHSTRYMGRDIPERPQLFKLSDDLSYKMLEKKSSQKIPNHSHSTIALLTELKHFSLNDTLTHSQRFNKGLVEYSLVYSKSNNKLKPVRPVSLEIEESVDKSLTKKIKLPNLFKLLNNRLQLPLNCIIDFGVSKHSNYDSLKASADIVLEEDLYASMCWQKKVSIKEENGFSEQLLNLRDATNFDLVLLWDIANFVPVKQLEQLFKKLSNHMSSGGLLHFVLPHSGMSAESPACFRVNSESEVDYTGELEGKMGQRVITTGQLVRILPGFKVLSYYFGAQENGSNYQEYLFEYVGK